MAKIALGGWQHETNTFATIKADLPAFMRADEWPPFSEGDQMFGAIEGVHLPINGAIDTLACAGHELIPLLWCSATPSAHVTEDAFETICRRFLDLIDQAMPLDGLYLDLHGAMVCEHLEDGEGALLSRIRQQVGPDLPIFVSLDLHANVTPQMVEHATMIDIFRTYPHIDMGETGARVAQNLDYHLAHSKPLYRSFTQIDFVIALNSGCSLIEPCRGIYQALPQFIDEQTVSLAFACGFHLSDIFHMGPSVVGYGYDEAAVSSSVAQLADLIHAQRDHFHQHIWPENQGVAKTVSLLEESDSDIRIVLADTQDNPGGGGAGDTTGLLQALIRHNVNNAIVATIKDPQVAKRAHELGVGAKFRGSLGGKSGLPGQRPFDCEITVEQLTDGNLVATGPMYLGARMALGPCALVDIMGVKALISSQPVQTADQAIIRHAGVDLDEMSVIALKSSVHYRNDFELWASHILTVASPGAVFADPSQLSYERLRPSIEVLSMGASAS